MNTEGTEKNNGHNPKLQGWFMPESLDEKIMKRALTIRAWRERNAFIHGLINDACVVKSANAVTLNSLTSTEITHQDDYRLPGDVRRLQTSAEAKESRRDAFRAVERAALAA